MSHHLDAGQRHSHFPLLAAYEILFVPIIVRDKHLLWDKMSWRSSRNCVFRELVTWVFATDSKVAWNQEVTKFERPSKRKIKIKWPNKSTWIVLDYYPQWLKHFNPNNPFLPTCQERMTRPFWKRNRNLLREQPPSWKSTPNCCGTSSYVVAAHWQSFFNYTICSFFPQKIND